MPRLLIKCTTCKAIVDTGYTSDSLAAFCSAKFENKVGCYNYQTELTWNKNEVLAFLSVKL